MTTCMATTAHQHIYAATYQKIVFSFELSIRSRPTNKKFSEKNENIDKQFLPIKTKSNGELGLRGKTD